MTDQRTNGRAARDRGFSRWSVVAALLVVAVAFAALPTLAHIPARLIDGCVRWIALAGGLELLSVVGFVVVFKLVFGARMTWRQGSPAGLRALAASTVLPAGGLVGPAAGAWSAGAERTSLRRFTRATIAFVLLTNAPGVLVVAVLGLVLWLGVPGGPHELALTLVPAVVALAVLAAAWFTRRPGEVSAVVDTRRRRNLSLHLASATGTVREGIADARGLVVTGNWKLIGAFAYYAFDNAVLWAAFHAYGRTPPVSVIVMAYVIGSLGAAMPTPAGIGAVEGGLFGALVLYGAPAARQARRCCSTEASRSRSHSWWAHLPGLDALQGNVWRGEATAPMPT